MSDAPSSAPPAPDVDSPREPPPGDGTWTGHLARALTAARACSRLFLVAPELLLLVSLETRQRVHTGPFAGAIDLDIGIIATLDPVGHPDRLPTDTVVWACGAYGCCCGNCRPEQACPTRAPSNRSTAQPERTTSSSATPTGPTRSTTSTDSSEPTAGPPPPPAKRRSDCDGVSVGHRDAGSPAKRPAAAPTFPRPHPYPTNMVARCRYPR